MRTTILTACCFFIMHFATAQSDSIEYINGLPITNQDTLPAGGADIDITNEKFVTLSPEQLPSEIVKTLNEDTLYKEWQNARIVLDKNTHLYWLHFSAGNTIRSYGFSKEGSVVSIDEKTKTEE